MQSCEGQLSYLVKTQQNGRTDCCQAVLWDRESTLAELIEKDQAAVYSHRYTTLKALQPPPISVITHYNLL